MKPNPMNRKRMNRKTRTLLLRSVTLLYGAALLPQAAAQPAAPAKPPVAEKSQEFALTAGISAEAYPGTKYDQPLRPQFHFSSLRNWLNDPNGMVYAGDKYHFFFSTTRRARNGAT